MSAGSASTPRYTAAYTPTTRPELAAAAHLHLTPAGLDVVVGELLAATGATAMRRVTCEEIARFVMERTLHGIGARVLPERGSTPTGTPTTLTVTAWLQLQSARDITKSAAECESRRSSGSGTNPRRMLQFELTDGVDTILALEFVALPHISAHQLVPGAKLLVRVGTKILNGMLLLTPACVGAIAGRVEALASAHAIHLTASARSESSTNASNTHTSPPVWRPFADRALVQAEQERERAIALARKAQEEAALAQTKPIKLMPPPQVEDAAGGRSKMNATTHNKAATATTAASSSARLHTQIELEEEYQEQERSRAAAASTAAASAAATAARAAKHAAATTPGVLSSFRTLLTAPLQSTQTFSAQVVEAQLYPPRAPSIDFILQLTLADAFGLRCNATASTTVFESLFGTQEAFRASMKDATGQALVQKRLATVRASLCNKQFVDVEIEIRAGNTPNAPRAFTLQSLAVKSKPKPG